MHPKQNHRKCMLACGSILVGTGILLVFLAPWFYVISTNFALSLSPTIMFNAWKEFPMPIYLEIYIFNWTNPEDIQNPKIKPHFQEIGPFVFEETTKKVNITWNQNNTVTYNNLRHWYFRESKSCCNLSTKITTINAVPVFAASQIENWSFFIKKGFDLSISALSAKLPKVTTADEIIFSGYDDVFIKLVTSLQKDSPLLVKGFDKFGWFYTRNGSYTFDGTFNMVYSGPNVANIEEWNYKKYMSHYNTNGECNKVRGSAGMFYPRNSKRDKIGAFWPDICRYVALDYESDENIDGTPGYKYIAGDSFFDNGTKVPENKCYCGEYCTPYGALNVSSCKYGTPSFVSQPHFYGADPYYLDKISGLNPTKAKHQTFMVIEPETGVPLNGAVKLQMNVLIKPIQSISMLKGVPTFLFPVMWFEQKIQIPTPLHFILKVLLHTRLILRCLGATMIIIGVLLLYKLYGKKLCQRSGRKSLKTMNLSSSYTEDSAKPLMELGINKKSFE